MLLELAACDILVDTVDWLVQPDPTLSRQQRHQRQRSRSPGPGENAAQPAPLVAPGLQALLIAMSAVTSRLQAVLDLFQDSEGILDPGPPTTAVAAPCPSALTSQARQYSRRAEEVLRSWLASPAGSSHQAALLLLRAERALVRLRPPGLHQLPRRQRGGLQGPALRRLTPGALLQ